MPDDERLRPPAVYDAVLASEAARGDLSAFTDLVLRHSRMMWVVVNRILRDSGEVDDIVQETLVVAWQKLPLLKDPAKIKSWLMIVATHRALDHLRRTLPETTIVDAEALVGGAAGPPEMAERAAMLAALHTALGSLPDLQRLSWELRELGGYSYSEISSTLDLPESTVRGLLSRARRRVSLQMAPWRSS